MANPFHFEWGVDQHGYEIVHVPASAGSLLSTMDAHDVIRPLGGPLRLYRPMDAKHGGLWRRFAESCTDAESVRAFVQEAGLLSDRPQDQVKDVVETAEFIRRIAANVDQGATKAAEALFNDAQPRLTARLVDSEYKNVPFTLRGALLLQAGEAIARKQRWRRCKNEWCPEWFRIGTGARTARREFCSDRCRVAWARHRKHKEEERHA